MSKAPLATALYDAPTIELRDGHEQPLLEAKPAEQDPAKMEGSAVIALARASTIMLGRHWETQLTPDGQDDLRIASSLRTQATLNKARLHEDPSGEIVIFNDTGPIRSDSSRAA